VPSRDEAAVTSTCPAGARVSDGVALLEVGDGRRRNALDSAGWDALRRTVTGLPDDVVAVVVRGVGGTFCAGSDLREWDGAAPAVVDASFAAMEAALRAVEAVPVPTLAVVTGAATGAGCLLALACDTQLVARSAVVGMPVARLGILLSPAFATRLTLRVGPTRAKELLFTGRILGADEAAATGLVGRVVDDTALEAELDSLLELWRAQPTASLRAAKRAVDAGVAPLTEAARAVPPGPSSDRTEMAGRVREFLTRGRGGHTPRSTRGA
jgi:enoyl-CoA hydratase/carnithine racemase